MTLTPRELQTTAHILRRLVRETCSNGLPGNVVARIYDMGLVKVEQWPACHVVVTDRGRALLEEADAAEAEAMEDIHQCESDA